MNTDRNRESAIAFYKTAYLGNPRGAVEKYVGDAYIQHKPLVANGPQPFIEYFERMAVEYPANGKIVEHWDALQEIPDTSANGNTMYQDKVPLI
jgi:predicted SnoaL-like aldol condensation-catalyzing enzyme